MTTAVTFTVSVIGGTASSGDYKGSTTATLTIAAGQTTATFSITIKPDKNAEGDETIVVGLSKVSAGVGVGDGEGVITIIDDD